MCQSININEFDNTNDIIYSDNDYDSDDDNDESEDESEDNHDYENSCDCCCKGWNIPNEFGLCQCWCSNCKKPLEECRYTCDYDKK